MEEDGESLPQDDAWGVHSRLQVVLLHGGALGLQLALDWMISIIRVFFQRLRENLIKLE